MQHGASEKITVDGYPATHTAINELKAARLLPPETTIRTSKYLNNLSGQAHRRVKQRIYPMLGFKRFRNAKITISGIELARQIRKGQFDTSGISQERTSAGQVREAILAA
jgi:transposase-like protein